MNKWSYINRVYLYCWCSYIYIFFPLNCFFAPFQMTYKSRCNHSMSLHSNCHYFFVCRQFFPVFFFYSNTIRIQTREPFPLFSNNNAIYTHDFAVSVIYLQFYHFSFVAQSFSRIFNGIFFISLIIVLVPPVSENVCTDLNL